MDPFEAKIRESFAAQRAGARPAGVYPDAEDFLRYLTGKMSPEEEDRMVLHLSSNAEDQAFVLRARRMLGSADRPVSALVPQRLIRAAQALRSPDLCPHCGKALPLRKPSPPRAWMKNTLLGSALAAFTLSFVFPRHFLQWLALAVVLGVKWAIDLKAFRTQLLIYKAITDEPRDLHRHSSHL